MDDLKEDSPVAAGEIESKELCQLGKNITRKNDASQEAVSLDAEIGIAEKAYLRDRNTVVWRMASLGKLYLQKKVELGHGRFTPWIKSRDISEVEIRRCIRVFEEFPEVLNKQLPDSERYKKAISDVLSLEATDDAGQISHTVTDIENTNISEGLKSLTQNAVMAIIHAPKPVKAEIKNRLANGETVTKKQILELKSKADIEPPGQGNDVIDAVFEEVPRDSAPANDPEEYTELDHLRDSLSDANETIKRLEERVAYFQAVFEADNKLAAFSREADKLLDVQRGLQSRIDGLIHENAEMKRQLNKLDAKCKRQAKLLKEAGHE